MTFVENIKSFAEKVSSDIKSLYDGKADKEDFDKLSSSFQNVKAELKGDPGPQGIQGIQGVPGIPGSKGEDGKSAYEIWLGEGNRGNKQDFLNSLQVSSTEIDNKFRAILDKLKDINSKL